MTERISSVKENSPPSRLGTILLCGGESRRMGTPKAWLDWNGQPLLEYLVSILSQVSKEIVVVAAPGQDLPDLPSGVRRLDDPVRYEGPLYGMNVGLSAMPADCTSAFVTGCDTPFITADFIEELASLLGDHEIVVPKDDRFFHPLAAIYRTALVPRIHDLIQQGKRKPRQLLDLSDTLPVDPQALNTFDSSGLTLRNMNTPEDYHEAQQLASQNKRSRKA